MARRGLWGIPASRDCDSASSRFEARSWCRHFPREAPPCGRLLEHGALSVNKMEALGTCTRVSFVQVEDDGVESSQTSGASICSVVGDERSFLLFILEWLHRRGSDARNKQEIPPWNHLD